MRLLPINFWFFKADLSLPKDKCFSLMIVSCQILEFILLLSLLK